jgi:hypothetical protein
MVQRSQSANSPLALHPDILDEVAKYVHVPGYVSKPYSPDAFLIRGIEHTCYEYANLMSSAYWSMHGTAPWRTHADDAFLIGYRKMHDFLVRKTRSKRNGGELPDILALDYLPNGYVPNWTLPTWTREWRETMDKQLAHLSYEREKLWDHRQWVPTLEEEFRNAWRLFLQAIDPQYKQEFAKQIEHCSSKQGFADIRL